MRTPSIKVPIKETFSVGYDEIPDKLVKECIQFIKKPLTFIFNISLCSGTFPNLMKIAKVRPIYKKGGLQEISNYQYQFCQFFFKNSRNLNI
jgi:hypothetical protein